MIRQDWRVECVCIKPSARTVASRDSDCAGSAAQRPEAATALGLSKTMLYELIRSKRLRTVKQGRRRLVQVAALAEYVADLEGVA